MVGAAETTRTRVFGLFVVADARQLALAQLVRLGEVTGLTATNVKSHVSRMVADGSLIRIGPPGASRYAPSRHRLRVVQVLRDRLAPPPDERWDRSWWVLGIDLPPLRARREQLRRALRFDGFRSPNAGLWLRPAWPSQIAYAAATRFVERHGCIASRGQIVGALDAAKVFQLDRAEREASRLLSWIERARRLLRSGDGALVTSWLALGGIVVTFASDYPQLPPALLGDRAATRTLRTEWSAFERDARAASRDFMRSMLADSSRRRA